MAEKYEYTIEEVLQEALADESWEPDQARREMAIGSIRMSLMM